ncbi:MAG: SLBB domain-containing protein [Butyricimonas faecihominis]
MTVNGEVLYPGVYAKRSSNDRLSDIVKRAGGVTSKAYVNGARLLRRMNADELARVSSALQLAKHSSRDSLVIDRMSLEKVYYVGIDLKKHWKIREVRQTWYFVKVMCCTFLNYVNTVKISGAVMHPNAVTYHKKMKYKDYVENAGGYSVDAKKRRAYVLYPNGTLAVCKGNGSKIEPGCEIIVPLKSMNKNRMGLPEILSLASSTTSIAAMVTAILNNTK